MSDLFFRWVGFADAFGEWRAEFYLGFFVAFYWAVLFYSPLVPWVVFFGLRGFAAGFGFFFPPFPKDWKFQIWGKYLLTDLPNTYVLSH